MSRLVTIAALALLTLTTSSGVYAAIKGREAADLNVRVKAHVACDQAVQGADILVSAERCPAKIAAVHAVALRAEACDQALLKADLFTIRTSCSTEVMTLLGERDAESRRADRQTETLAAERVDRAAAITRAEARVRTATERKVRAEAVIQDAPRDGDGLVVLNARRLCELRDASDACDAPP